MNQRELYAGITRDLIDSGLLIEFGWRTLCTTVVPPDASAVQLNEMRMAFFSGALHLYSSIMSMLEPGAEPTDNDMHRFHKIDSELEKFSDELKLRITPAGGSG